MGCDPDTPHPSIVSGDDLSLGTPRRGGFSKLLDRDRLDDAFL